jgi:putative sigma-54 modulation protein
MSKETLAPLDLTASVTFRHTESTAAIKNYAIEKVTQRVAKYVHGAATANIILSVEKLEQLAEVHLVAKGLDIMAKATTNDLYSAIDKLADTLEAQLRKIKEKSLSQRGHVELEQAEL